MSVSALVICFTLIAQVTADDRYGAPATSPFAEQPGEPASAGVQSPNASPPVATPPGRKSAVSPPPAFSPPATTSQTVPETQSTTPAITSRATNPPPNANPAAKPSALMRTMLTAPPGSRLTGRPVSLVEIVAGASSREAQSQRVEAYWDLCSSVADYYLGVREQDELQRLRSSVEGVSPTWQEAEAELGVRIGTSQRAAVASQHRLASLLGRATETLLPLPADLPHCGDYYARYDQVFAGRETLEAQQLSELLPMRYEELCGASLAVTRAEEFLNAAAAQRGGDGTGTLRALELLALRRRAFVQIARDYNRRIARYTELASPGPIDSVRLIGMLIMREGAANTATRPATLAPPPSRQSQLPADDVIQTVGEISGQAVDPASDQTFAEGWESIKSASAEFPVDEGVTPVSTEAKRLKPRRERSLLVPSE